VFFDLPIAAIWRYYMARSKSGKARRRTLIRQRKNRWKKRERVRVAEKVKSGGASA